MDNGRYDRLVYDGARFFAELYRGRPEPMYNALRVIGATEDGANAVLHAMNATEYHEDYYRGAMVDEGVVEAIKDILRPIAGF